MGQFFNIKCKNCGVEEHYTLGRGFLSLEPRVYEEIRKNPDYEKLRTHIHRPEDLYDACYKVYYCRECKTFENHISFKVRDCAAFRILRKCKKCGKTMKGMSDSQSFWSQKLELKCRKCGAEDVLNMEGIIPGFWD